MSWKATFPSSSCFHWLTSLTQIGLPGSTMAVGLTVRCGWHFNWLKKKRKKKKGLTDVILFGFLYLLRKKRSWIRKKERLHLAMNPTPYVSAVCWLKDFLCHFSHTLFMSLENILPSLSLLSVPLSCQPLYPFLSLSFLISSHPISSFIGCSACQSVRVLHSVDIYESNLFITKSIGLLFPYYRWVMWPWWITDNKLLIFSCHYD